MSATKALIKGGAWLAFAEFISKIASALSLPVLARLLGPESFGIYSVIFSLALSAQNISGLGVDIAMHRNGAQHKIIGTEAVGRLFGVGLSLVCLTSTIIGVSILLFHKELANNWLGKPEVAPWLALTSIVIVLQPFGNIPLLFLASLHAFRAYALRSSVSNILGNLVLVFFTWHFKLLGAVSGLISIAIIQIFWNYLVAKPVLRENRIKLRVDRFFEQSRFILKFGFPYYFGITLLGSFATLPLMGLVSQYGGLEELGYLRSAESVGALIGFIPAAIAPAAISYLSAATGSNQSSRLKSIHIRTVWSVVLLSAGTLCIPLPSIVNFLFGAAYEKALNLAWFQLWLTLVVCITSVVIQRLVADGKTLKVCFASSLGVICFVLSAMYLVPQHKALGFLMAKMISQLAILLCTIYPAILIDTKSSDLLLLINLTTLTFLLFTWTRIISDFHLTPIMTYIVAGLTCVSAAIFIVFTSLDNFERLKLLKLKLMFKR